MNSKCIQIGHCIQDQGTDAGSPSQDKPMEPPRGIPEENKVKDTYYQPNEAEEERSSQVDSEHEDDKTEYPQRSSQETITIFWRAGYQRLQTPVPLGSMIRRELSWRFLLILSP
jgi:hypothetical protein